jgi:hypothetical protein
MKPSYIIAAGLGALAVIPAQAYKYTFNNKSDKKAIVEFKLALDLTTGNKDEKIEVLAGDTNFINISEWHRAGLCMDMQSIRVKFDGAKDFSSVIITKSQDGFNRAAQKIGFIDRAHFSLPQCGNITFDLSYTREQYGSFGIFPILLIR